MPVAPNPVTTIVTQWGVRLGAADGSDPTAADETTIFGDPIVHLRSNKDLDYCELPVDINGTTPQIVNLQLVSGLSRQVEIFQISQKFGQPNTLVFWGEINAQRLNVNRGERARLLATIEPYHFGNVLTQTMYRDPDAPHDPIYTDDPIVFNPLINDIIEENRSKYEYTPAAGENRYFWVHPESVRNAVARAEAQDNDLQDSWTLADAVRTICWQCNPDETYIKNPTEAEFDTWLANAATVKNLELPTGKYLPEYLDLMLNKFGYSWAMTYAYDSSGDRRVSYRIFALNFGINAFLMQQRPDDVRPFSLKLTNVKEWDIETGTLGQVNQVTCLGAKKEFEITAPLNRGWIEAYDGLTAAGLTQSTSGSSWYTDGSQRAWRLWVFNEGGMYTGTRTVVAPISATPDLSAVFDADYIVRNREPLDCLTCFIDETNSQTKRRRPPYIEWKPNAPSGGWTAIPDGWGETILSDQGAVWFGGDSPPAELIAQGDDAVLRVTFTFQSDERLTGQSTRSASSINSRVNELVIDVSDRFKYREVVSTGTYASQFSGVDPNVGINDQTAIDDFASALRVIEDAAIQRGTIRLYGINPQFKIGQTLTDIRGRNVSLNRMSITSRTKKYLQIVGIEHIIAEQETILTVAPVLEAIP